ncbi:MAG: TetR/AcrR family transcriptional regulator [Corynebacteriales bacterium]|nr:TetR/AcrR family transcriptional regulator [Mycobacteriales bacterium]
MGTTTLENMSTEQRKRQDVVGNSQLPSVDEKPLRADARRNRERIIAVARAAFIDEGADVQMEEIAKRAGLGVGTLYRNFPTKDALFGEVMRDQMARIVDALALALEDENTDLAFRALVLTWAEDAAKHIGLREMVAEFPDATACAGQSARYNELMEVFLERAHREGHIRSDITVVDFRGLMCGLAASIAIGADWKRCAEVILSGLKPIE